ncbi:MAG TPA: rhamnogalacturonan acetylesterase [Opitutaceae bacterium]|nr:rhamnogalacturonan acetylesterase [Opitutaceae bacterium]
MPFSLAAALALTFDVLAVSSLAAAPTTVSSVNTPARANRDGEADVTEASPFSRNFSFATTADKNATRVSSEAFSPEKTFGFEEVNRNQIEQIPLGIRGQKPFRFSVVVPEGNLEVTVMAKADPAQAPHPLTIKAESRRLMVESWQPSGSGEETKTFIVNVRNPLLPPTPANAPGKPSVELNKRELSSLNWDGKLTLEFSSSSVLVTGIRIRAVKRPTIFITGDSTVTDQPSEPAASWGQMFPRFMSPAVAVANHAESGETLKSFLYEMRLSKVLSLLAPGDFVFIEFGHNDEKKQWPINYVEANTTYKAYLRTYIAEIRLRHATPVLLTPIQRRTFDEHGRIRNSHGDYPAAVRDVAKEQNVVLIDLDKASTALYEALGPANAPRAFNKGGQDATHHNNYGAYELAKCVVQQIKNSSLPIAADVAADFSSFDPSHPDDVAKFDVAPSPETGDVEIRGN